MAINSLHVKSLIPFGIVLIGGWVVGLVILIIWGYEGSFLLLNSYHTPFLDKIMPHTTHIGQGIWLGAILALIWAKKNPALVISLIFGLLLSLLVVVCCKQLLFDDWYRPKYIFKVQNVPIHYVALRDLYYFSFPSGHSVGGTLVMGFWAYELGKRSKYFAAVLGLIALVVVYTRLYIGVHFLGDVLVGSIIGAGILWGLLTYLYPRLGKWIARLSASHQRIMTMILYIGSGGTLIYSIYHLMTVYYGYA